jgi:SAM-dependent methyltransferase
MSATPPACLSCAAPLRETLVDLGEQPLANAYLAADQLGEAEARYPLHARICAQCLLVQVEPVVPPGAIFSDYAYFSSYSTSWLEHCAAYVRGVTGRLGLTAESMVIEIASNDGYLLRNFVEAGVPVLGVEPAANVAEVAIAAGIPTDVAFFGRAHAAEVVRRGQAADLVIANNVLAHVPDLEDFAGGIAAVLKPGGVLTVEVPHLLRMLEGTEFDTIYHEHLSYFSLLAARDVLRRRGLRVFDVEELPTHGGSLRIWASREEAAGAWPETPAVERIAGSERAAGLDDLATYRGFAGRVQALLDDLRGFLRDAASAGERVAAYGAAAKGNTLLNAAGVGADDIAYVVDRSPHKQGRFLPGSRIPILAPEHVRTDRPDYLLILPWNLRAEITSQMADVRDWGCRFVIPVPRLEVLP